MPSKSITDDVETDLLQASILEFIKIYIDVRNAVEVYIVL